MRVFLATVLSIIACGVLLIAYGLLSPRAAAPLSGPYGIDARGDAYALPRPVPSTDVVSLHGQAAFDPYYAYPAPLAYPASSVRPVRAVQTYQAPRRITTARRVRSGRDWRKTALLIGGSSAAGAGLGAIFGGKKGALIGAALGGGASTIFEAAKH